MMLFQLFLVPLVAARVMRTHPQVPLIAEVVEDVSTEVVQLSEESVLEERLPIVGIHFTTSYAVASVRYSNGTWKDLAKIPADAEYIEILSRYTAIWPRGDPLSLAANNCFVSADELPTPQKRLKRHDCIKTFFPKPAGDVAGRPLPADIIALAAFTKTVRNAIRSEFGGSIPNMAIIIPRLPFYLSSELFEALEIAGLRSTSLVSGGFDRFTYDEIDAAYAGHGYDYCTPELADCARVPGSQKYEHALYLNFDNSSFSAGMLELQNKYQMLDQDQIFGYTINPNLGWWNLPVFEVPRAKFWAQIHEMITSVVQALPQPINRIVLLGDHGADDEFKEVVKAAVWEVLEMDVELMLSVGEEDVTHIAARGAADLDWHISESRRRWEADMAEKRSSLRNE
ncbi:hypothetical protein BKA63DRAFT_488119 [Paraphoma chrysanthemicola]|nr:hypothetical protein BKA63DRAFT_488119 [Paraphoma chrysanthemicola]